MPLGLQDLKEYGAVVFRGFEISKDKETFGQALCCCAQPWELPTLEVVLEDHGSRMIHEGLTDDKWTNDALNGC